jgi:hypothetical protein
MIITKTAKVSLTKKELIDLLSKHFGAEVTDVDEVMETYGWSGQAWDDGPLPERLIGLSVSFKNEVTNI